MEKRKRLKSDFFLYCLFGLFALVMIKPSLDLGLGEIGEVGPGLLPFIALACVLSLSMVLVLLTLIRRPRPASLPPVEKMDSRTILRVVEILASLVVWPLLVGVIGYVLATFLVCLGMAKAIGYRGWVGPVVLSAAFAISVWFIFGFMFYVDLPAGISF